MLCLICRKCGLRWYTANTKYTAECDSCGGELVEDSESLLNLKSDENESKQQRQD